MLRPGARAVDTIVALATPPGRSAIGVIRLSGPDSLPIARALVDESQFTPVPACAVLKSITALPNRDVVDRALITYFKAPHSFTGEDVVEISGHGAPVTLRFIIDSVLRLDARLASPGEFTLRALRNGKINLSQAEAIRDLIDAQTRAAARQAVRQLNGELSNFLQPVKGRLIEIIVPLESSVEFVEDDLPLIQAQRLKRELSTLLAELDDLASTFSSGRVLRDGLRVTIVGPPNAGKSSLFNKLLGIDRAIVTEIPGTTRDTLSEQVSFSGVPILLTDTAGVRDSVEAIESIGVERTHRAMAEADLLLVVVDGSINPSAADQEFLSRAREGPHVIALNKCDLISSRNGLANRLSRESRVVSVSAKTGAGLDDLRAALTQPFAMVDSQETGLLITDARHYDLLSRAVHELASASRLLDQGSSEELVLVGLHNGLRLLGEITGETTTEDVLSRIFATFCIGK